MDEELSLFLGKNRTMNVTETIWNFVIKQVNAWNFDIEQENNWSFKVRVQVSGDWILKDGFWDDNGIWIDSEIWKDS